MADDWEDRDYYWPTVTAGDGSVYDVHRIPAGTAILGDLIASTVMFERYGAFALPEGLTVRGHVWLSALMPVPEDLTIHGHLDFDDDRPLSHLPRYGYGDGEIEIDESGKLRLPESLWVSKEIYISDRRKLARPIPRHLYPLIKVQDRKLGGLRKEYLSVIDARENENGDDDDDRRHFVPGRP